MDQPPVPLHRPNIDTLPTELYTLILSHLYDSNTSPTTSPNYGLFRQTLLALSRALPRSPVPTECLFMGDVKLKTQHQLVALERRVKLGQPEGVFRRSADQDSSAVSEEEGEDITDNFGNLSINPPPPALFDPAPYLTSLTITAWDIDGEVLVNLLRRLGHLEVLRLRIGPVNFGVKGLEALMKELGARQILQDSTGDTMKVEIKQKTILISLELRFRPYVQKATYLPFLAGSYYDSSLIALSHWDIGTPTLSIVQDPDRTGIKSFAQPIVFHLLDQSLSKLVHSNGWSRVLKELRVRIPGRGVVGPLTTVYAVNSSASPNSPKSGGEGQEIPRLKTLDLSTTFIRESDVDTLLSRFGELENLVLDDCPGLVRHNSGPAMGEEWGWWYGVGKRWASWGVKKARDKEKEVRGLLEGLRERAVSERDSQKSRDEEEETRSRGDGGEGGQAVPERKARQGRRGLATATITLRGANILSSVDAQVQLPPGLSEFISPSHSGPLPKIHIIPPIPRLKTIGMHTELKGSLSNLGDDELKKVKERVVTEFGEGWKDGLKMVWARRERMSVTFKREGRDCEKARFFKYRDGDEDEDEDELVPVLDEEDADEVFVKKEEVEIPRLCLDGTHELSIDEDCAHRITSNWAECND